MSPTRQRTLRPGEDESEMLLDGASLHPGRKPCTLHSCYPINPSRLPLKPLRSPQAPFLSSSKSHSVPLYRTSLHPPKSYPCLQGLPCSSGLPQSALWVVRGQSRSGRNRVVTLNFMNRLRGCGGKADSQSPPCVSLSEEGGGQGQEWVWKAVGGELGGGRSGAPPYPALGGQ